MTAKHMRGAPVTRSGGRPTLAEARAITQRIVSVATRAFLDKGYAATSMEEVAIAGGVAKRTLYSRFAAKSDLFREVVLSYSGQTLGALPEPSEHGAPLADQLFDSCMRIMDIVMAPDVIALRRMIAAEVGRFPELAISIEMARDQAIDHLSAILAGAVRRGELCLADVRLAAQQLMGMTVELEVRRVVMGLAPAEVSKAAAERTRAGIGLFLDGCRARPST